MTEQIRMPVEAFDLRTGIFGEIAQKITNYQVRLAVIGDVSGFTAASKAFADWVYETNTGNALWLLPDMASLEKRL